MYVLFVLFTSIIAQTELKHIIVYSFNNILLITTLFHNPFDTCMIAVEECYGNASKTLWLYVRISGYAVAGYIYLKYQKHFFFYYLSAVKFSLMIIFMVPLIIPYTYYF